jgi:aerobic carbon-monoxide dehydrogenase medium subunit
LVFDELPMKFASPDTLEDALKLLAEDGARCLAGGQSLVAMMNAQLVSPTTLVSLRGIPELAAITTLPDGGLRIGAMVPHAAVARLKPTAAGPALLAKTAAEIGHPAIRNQGTIGGSLAHADPAADYPAAAVCAGARIVVAGAAGRRAMPAGEFFKGFYETALRPGEIIVAVEIPPGPANGAAHYEKLAVVHGDFALVSAAVILAMKGGRCTSAAIAVGASAPAPVRVAEAEAALTGTALDDAALARAGALIAAACDPIDDFRGSATYRKKLVPRIVARAVRAAQARCLAHV